jgi:TonB dependent receptor/TonB-dependent Receptor Plug Domain/CarboxypepD_reg-like domain
MKKIFYIICFLLLFANLKAQEINLAGMVCDSSTRFPLSGCTIVMTGTGRTVVTDESGRFIFHGVTNANHHVVISAVGFRKTAVDLTCPGSAVILLSHKQTSLADVVVTAFSNNPYKSLMENDIEMRGVSNAQEVMRMVPGLFIGQHQGGGKAEQIFLRGFDADHGTDINVQVDGMPVNMVSHAHGQGYADSHFIIPETIERASFNKGPYEAQKGDFATAGYLEFHTWDAIRENMITMEGGQFGTFRGMVMLNLLGNRQKIEKRSWYAASEYSFTNSYFDHPEHFKRFNLFSKFSTELGSRNMLTISASTFWTSWYASGQIPERAIDSGLVDYFGALDPEEGGVSSRTNINIQLRTSFHNGDLLKNQVYYSNYHFDLHSNFGFFLTDTVNGDEIRQLESRNLAGYNGSYIHSLTLSQTHLTSEFGVNIRTDQTSHTALEHTVNRYTLLDMEKLGNITELGTGFYINETLRWNNKWHLNAGLRYDAFLYRYDNLLAADSTFKGPGIYKGKNQILSPKLSIYYQADAKTEFYVSMGKGFHTNDTRVAVAAGDGQTLPAAYAGDLGLIYKPFRNAFIQAAFWYIYLQQEFVYGGDGGTVDFSGKTKRYGIDLSCRYQWGKYIFFDLDMNLAHGRTVGVKKGEDYIPLAPVWSSTAGVNYRGSQGFNVSLRYRYLSERPANEDHSFVCQGYFVNDLVVNYRRKNLEYGLIVNNLFNVKWRETQFYTLTRFKNESHPVDGISFTPGTKFALRLAVRFFFN